MSNEPKKITLGLVLSWIFAVFMIFGGLGLISSGSIGSGIVLMLAGVVLCPITHKMMKNKGNIVMSGALKFVIALVLVTIAIVLMPKADQIPATSVSTPQDINTVNTDNTEDTNANTEPTQTEQAQAVEEKADLELLEDTTTQDGYARYIEGKVRNNTDQKYTYAQISFNLYDDEGALVGTALANVNNLEPGGIWKFKAMIMNQEATSYKLGDLTGF